MMAANSVPVMTACVFRPNMGPLLNADRPPPVCHLAPSVQLFQEYRHGYPGRHRWLLAGAIAMNDAAQNQPPFARFLGMKITHLSPERVTAELAMREDFNNRHGIMHGGAIMALADNLGGTATTANLKPGQTTTTIESKTNFFAAIPLGDIAKAECTPLHRG
ncbi:MAG: PaaI family thioesterase, partial [Pseudolabrys sp.]